MTKAKKQAKKQVKKKTKKLGQPCHVPTDHLRAIVRNAAISKKTKTWICNYTDMNIRTLNKYYSDIFEKAPFELDMIALTGLAKNMLQLKEASIFFYLKNSMPEVFLAGDKWLKKKEMEDVARSYDHLNYTIFKPESTKPVIEVIEEIEEEISSDK